MLDKTRKTLSAMTGEETLPPSLEAMVDGVEKTKHARESGPLSIEMLALLLWQHEGGAVAEAAKPKPKPKAEPEYNGKWAGVKKGTKIELEGEDGPKTGTYLGRMSRGPHKGKLRVKVDGDDAPHRTVPAESVSIVEMV